jgi:hypothetical protein
MLCNFFALFFCSPAPISHRFCLITFTHFLPMTNLNRIKTKNFFSKSLSQNLE